MSGYTPRERATRASTLSLILEEMRKHNLFSAFLAAALRSILRDSRRTGDHWDVVWKEVIREWHNYRYSVYNQ